MRLFRRLLSAAVLALENTSMSASSAVALIGFSVQHLREDLRGSCALEEAKISPLSLWPCSGPGPVAMVQAAQAVRRAAGRPSPKRGSAARVARSSLLAARHCLTAASAAAAGHLRDANFHGSPAFASEGSSLTWMRRWHPRAVSISRAVGHTALRVFEEWARCGFAARASTTTGI